MSIVSYIVIALAFGLSNMLLFYRCGNANPIKLTSGIAKAAAVAIIHAALYYIGIVLGGILCFSSADDPSRYTDINTYIFLGIMVAVVVKMFAPYLRREPKLPVFSLTRWGSVLAMSVATGINLLLVGIGVGFVSTGGSQTAAIWILLAISIVLSTIGLMFGRQAVAIRPRRWMAVSCLLLLGVAVSSLISL